MGLPEFALLAPIFDYPEAGFGEKLPAILEMVGSLYPQAKEDIDLFAKALGEGALEGENLDAIQELYTRTFDIQPITTLDVGFVLFGDDYKRGEILSNLNKEHIASQNPCGNELADHLPNLLRLIALKGKDDFVLELVDMILAPALRAMVREFDPERVEKKNKYYKKQYKTLIETPEVDSIAYRHALKACYTILSTEFELPEVDAAEAEQTSDFLRSIRTENETEDIKGS
jgi:nitrate reductase assembly molybdenum cofactor insertion protein NarJ